MNFEVVEIRRLVRRMRGGSQSHLVEGSDGRFYIAKWVDNPQGTRTLVNEWVAHRLMLQLEISTPRMRILRLSREMCATSNDLYFDLPQNRRLVQPGLHLASECPANPETTAIFDFLPVKLLSQLSNCTDFARCLVLDALMGQCDRRQAVFVRDRAARGRPCCRAHLIDHGMAFGGSSWMLPSIRSSGLYADHSVYRLISSTSVWIEAIEQACAIREHDLLAAVAGIPAEWFGAGDYESLKEVFVAVLRRRKELWSHVQCQLQTLGMDVVLGSDQHAQPYIHG